MLSNNKNHWERHRLMFKKRLTQRSERVKSGSQWRQSSLTQRTTSEDNRMAFHTNNESNNYFNFSLRDIISFGNFEFSYDLTFRDNLRQLTKELKKAFSTEESRNKSRNLAKNIEQNVTERKKELVQLIKDKIVAIDQISETTLESTQLTQRTQMSQLSQNNSGDESDDNSDDGYQLSQRLESECIPDPSLPQHLQYYMKSLLYDPSITGQKFMFSDENNLNWTPSQMQSSVSPDDSGIHSLPVIKIEPTINSVINEKPESSQNATQMNESTQRLQIVNRHKWTNTDYDIATGITLKVVPENKVRTQRKRKRQLKFVLQKILDLIECNVFCTKRDLYYQNVLLFDKSQRVVDEIIDDLASSLRTSRTRLHIVSSTRGLVFGHLKFHNTNGVLTDCLSSPNGINIPNDTERIDRIHSNALFVMIIEKDATFQQLIDLRIHERYPLIMVTGHGYPDLNTRAFIQILWNTLEIPIFGLVDGDAHGLEILCTFRHGSLALSYESHNLVAPVIKWLGILPTDIIDYNLSPSVQITLNERDRKKIEDLKNRIYLKGNEEWTKQLNILLKLGKKVEIQSLAEHWPTFLLDVYLPAKIRYGKWI